MRGERLSGDLLITDVVMPEMSGPDLTSQISPLQPSTIVLYMSGHTAELFDNPRFHRMFLYRF
jgi:YesN/AraC family two-component response regulator